MNSKSYYFQYAKTGEFECSGCRKTIQQDDLRVYRKDGFELFPYSTNGWYHFDCLWLLEEAKNITENDVMLEIEARERNYQIGSWKYQAYKIAQHNTQFSFHDGLHCCLYTPLRYYDTGLERIKVTSKRSDLQRIRDKIYPKYFLQCCNDKKKKPALQTPEILMLILLLFVFFFAAN